MNKKKVIIIASCIVAVLAIVLGVKIVKDNSYKKSFSEDLEVAIAGSAYYDNKFELIDFMQPNRKVLLYMTADFNDLSREEKHIYMEDVLGEKVRHAFKDWITEDDKYNDIPKNDLTFLDIGIILKCEDSEYQYGIYVTTASGFTDIEYSFVDKDGTVYEYINDADRTEKLEAWIEGVEINNQVREELAQKDEAQNSQVVTDDTEKATCWALAKEVVLEKLKSPSSAEFPTYGNSGVTITCAGNLYTVKGYVDADNSFGASIRTTFTVTMEKSGSGDNAKFTAKTCVIDE